MALLNFSQTYAGISDKIGTPGYLQETDLLFTKDGHIVTHGVDYTPWGLGTIPIGNYQQLLRVMIPVMVLFGLV